MVSFGIQGADEFHVSIFVLVVVVTTPFPILIVSLLHF